MGVLRPRDRYAIRLMRKQGMLENIEGHRLHQKEGAILVSCGDGDQFCDLLNHKVKMQALHRRTARIHPCTVNGGALRLPPHSPLNREGSTMSEDLLEGIGEAASLKGIGTVALYSHAPCGKAGRHNLNALAAIDLLMDAKCYVEEAYPELIVACFFHVDYGTKKRTYFVSRKRWDEQRVLCGAAHDA